MKVAEHKTSVTFILPKISEGVAELKFWNFNVPYKAYMALTNVKTLQLWKFCNTLDMTLFLFEY